MGISRWIVHFYQLYTWSIHRISAVFLIAALFLPNVCRNFQPFESQSFPHHFCTAAATPLTAASNPMNRVFNCGFPMVSAAAAAAPLPPEGRTRFARRRRCRKEGRKEGRESTVAVALSNWGMHARTHGFNLGRGKLQLQIGLLPATIVVRI